MNSKPLFIPVNAKFFDAFKNGTKDTEYRRLGPRWNFTTCVIGRRVTISRGYGKKHRLTGVIVDSEPNLNPEQLPGWREVYKSDADVAICIKIKLDEVKPLLEIQPLTPPSSELTAMLKDVHSLWSNR